MEKATAAFFREKEISYAPFQPTTDLGSGLIFILAEKKLSSRIITRRLFFPSRKENKRGFRPSLHAGTTISTLSLCSIEDVLMMTDRTAKTEFNG